MLAVPTRELCLAAGIRVLCGGDEGGGGGAGGGSGHQRGACTVC